MKCRKCKQEKKKTDFPSTTNYYKRKDGELVKYVYTQTTCLQCKYVRDKELSFLKTFNNPNRPVKTSLKSVLSFVKQKMVIEKNEHVKLAWAQVGDELNKFLLPV